MGENGPPVGMGLRGYPQALPRPLVDALLGCASRGAQTSSSRTTRSACSRASTSVKRRWVGPLIHSSRCRLGSRGPSSGHSSPPISAATWASTCDPRRARSALRPVPYANSKGVPSACARAGAAIPARYHPASCVRPSIDSSRPRGEETLLDREKLYELVWSIPMALALVDRRRTMSRNAKQNKYIREDERMRAQAVAARD